MPPQNKSRNRIWLQPKAAKFDCLNPSNHPSIHISSYIFPYISLYKRGSWAGALRNLWRPMGGRPHFGQRLTDIGWSLMKYWHKLWFLMICTLKNPQSLFLSKKTKVGLQPELGVGVCCKWIVGDRLYGYVRRLSIHHTPNRSHIDIWKCKNTLPEKLFMQNWIN